MASTDLYDAMVEFFEACKTALADTPDGVPDCAYVSEGPPAWDSYPCLVVWSGGPVVADTFPLQPYLAAGHRVTVSGQVNVVTITAVVLRCATIMDESGLLPSPEDHAVAARQTSADLWALWNHLQQAKRAGTLFPPREREFFVDPAVALNQQGGAAGWQFTVRTALDGYRTS